MLLSYTRMWYEFLREVNIKTAILCDVTPSVSVEFYDLYGGTCPHHNFFYAKDKEMTLLQSTANPLSYRTAPKPTRLQGYLLSNSHAWVRSLVWHTEEKNITGPQHKV